MIGKSHAIFAVTAIALAALSGCQSARYVSMDSVGGVVAVPANSDNWPSYHRTKALELILAKCPNGYVIEREEEVVVGTTEHTHTDTETRGDPLLAALYVAPVEKKTQQTTTFHDKTEWRIWYRAK